MKFNIDMGPVWRVITPLLVIVGLILIVVFFLWAVLPKGLRPLAGIVGSILAILAILALVFWAYNIFPKMY